MNLPSRLSVHCCWAAGDGGSLLFDATDEQKGEHTIELIQHAYHYTKDPKRISGRLYFDGEIVPIRSDREAVIMALLRKAEIRSAPPEGVPWEQQYDDHLRDSLNRVIEYIESPRYLSFAAEQSEAS
jgi:hypothetical protein